ncbi:MAG: glycosyltransferase [Ignavibacteriaceae bacterium]
MPELIEMIFLAAVTGYFIQSVIFLTGVKKRFRKADTSELKSISVIVAARDEENNILRCLRSLDQLIYPENKLEIIIVDDKSTDNTGKIIDDFIKDKNRFKKIITRKEIGWLKGKTNALANAIEIANGEIILTTDADCEVNPNWALTIASYYTGNVAVVNGFTTQEVIGGFSGMQAIDFIYLLTVASGTINLDHPISCIGNNMSYLRKVYFEVGGYESLPFSVTEDFNMLNAIHKLGKYKIIMPLDKESLVVSKPCSSVRELFHQKKRWAVGGLRVPFRGYVVMFWGFTTNLLVLLLPFFFSTVWLYLTSFKIIIDLLVLYPVHKELGIKSKLKYFIHFQLYYLIYVVAIPFVLLISRKVFWKGRKY